MTLPATDLEAEIHLMISRYTGDLTRAHKLDMTVHICNHAYLRGREIIPSAHHNYFVVSGDAFNHQATFSYRILSAELFTQTP